MERMSAEGKFFHRQCFRCSVCKCNLLLGNYVFDDDGCSAGKFYCKLHFNRLVYNKPKPSAAEPKQGFYKSLILSLYTYTLNMFYIHVGCNSVCPLREFETGCRLWGASCFPPAVNSLGGGRVENICTVSEGRDRTRELQHSMCLFERLHQRVLPMFRTKSITIIFVLPCIVELYPFYLIEFIFIFILI